MRKMVRKRVRQRTGWLRINRAKSAEVEEGSRKTAGDQVVVRVAVGEEKRIVTGETRGEEEEEEVACWSAGLGALLTIAAAGVGRRGAEEDAVYPGKGKAKERDNGR